MAIDVLAAVSIPSLLYYRIGYSFKVDSDVLEHTSIVSTQTRQFNKLSELSKCGQIINELFFI